MSNVHGGSAVVLIRCVRCSSRLRHIQAICSRLLDQMVATIACLVSFTVVRRVCVVLLGVAVVVVIGWAGRHLIICVAMGSPDVVTTTAHVRSRPQLA